MLYWEIGKKFPLKNYMRQGKINVYLKCDIFACSIEYYVAVLMANEFHGSCEVVKITKCFLCSHEDMVT